MLPTLATINDEKLELSALNITPKNSIEAQIFKVVQNSEGKFLQSVASIDLMHFSWDSLEDLIG
jgi:hypothetical protein